MNVPLHLTLIRHGESEINLSNDRARQDDHRAHELPGFFDRHDSMFRLTDRGRDQAVITGEWIRQNIGEVFDQYYTSDYIRCKETAALLNLPGALWHSEFLLREQGVARLIEQPRKTNLEEYSREFSRQNLDGLFWIPPGGGETMAAVCARVRQVWQEICETHPDKHVIIVCHGGILRAFRVILEHMSLTQIIAQGNSHPLNAEPYYNCEVMQFSREDPEHTQVSDTFSWRQSICPRDLSLKNTGWLHFTQPIYSNEKLLEEAEQATRLLAE